MNKLGERHTQNGKQYVAVYEAKTSCDRCAFTTDGGQCKRTPLDLCMTEEGEEVVWIEVKKK